MLFRDAPSFATVEPTPKKVRFAKTRKSKRHTSSRTTRKNRAVSEQPEQQEISPAKVLWESYLSAVATITQLTKSSVY